MWRSRYDGSRALRLLRIGTGLPDAEFRPGQEEAVRHVVRGNGRLLVVQKTGWGKSFVYFIATKLLREMGAGPTLLISPLLALMRNQIAAAKRMGVHAEWITSANMNEWPEVEDLLVRDKVDLLLVAPERLANEHFRDDVLSHMAERIALLVIDEAHCISDWGHDFRPDYRLIERMARTLPRNLRLLATTATANHRVMQDLREVLGPDLRVHQGSLSRPSLFLQTIRLRRQEERLAWLAGAVPQLAGYGIIYTLTVRDADLVAEWLQSQGLDVHAYTAKKETEEKEELERALLKNQVKALVATVALGMGFDKPDLGFVIHYQTPGSVVFYYQQVGRAGRALAAAYGVLLSGDEETDITDYFIDTAFPTRNQVQRVIDTLEESPQGATLTDLRRSLNISGGRIKQTMKLLSLESPPPVVKQGSKWQLTAATLGQAFWDRAERLTELRREEQREMQEYVALRSRHMEFLVRALDGDPEAFEQPDLPSLSTSVAPVLVREAVAFLRRRALVIEPRKMWPAGGLPQYKIKGKIPDELRANEGRALSVWRDGGWGELVRQGKHAGRFDDKLVDACVRLLQRWSPEPTPAWVTCIPSRRHPDLVPDFARRLARALRLPFRAVLQQTKEPEEQKSMANSLQQALNLDGVLEVDQEPLPGPVLLVDDIVGSRWTFTVAAWLSRRHGSGEVWPLALSSLRGS
ncbi:MAG: ATP-dependent DNA helicase RecQ [Gammaproteobacteria bacterium]|nr:ATP-dependent DNA helicase RecQ [Gammaproteobacteria bacterium]MYF62230.1 ATP-dependent DNA helicase RecQ [Gammaproteobacteria bacterium]MYI21384.1 ATP-dependent DNA helicase RecQ [Gammaproteobacteria bacterium]